MLLVDQIFPMKQRFSLSFLKKNDRGENCRSFAFFVGPNSKLFGLIGSPTKITIIKEIDFTGAINFPTSSFLVF